MTCVRVFKKLAATVAVGIVLTSSMAAAAVRVTATAIPTSTGGGVRYPDAAYDEAQREGHEQAVVLFESYAKNGDNADLKKWAGKTLPHLKKHLSMAQKLK